MICADTNGLDKLKDEAVKGRRHLFSSSPFHLCIYASTHLFFRGANTQHWPSLMNRPNHWSSQPVTNHSTDYSYEQTRKPVTKS
jgi:hypothetical protein